MDIVIRIFIGLGIAGIGVFMVIKTRIILDFFGTWDWAEAKLSGGSNLFYKLIGIVAIFLGFLYATNLWNAFLTAVFGGLFGLNR